MSISGISGTDNYYYLLQLMRQAASSSSSSSTSSSSDIFNSIDTNGDGSVSKSELETFLSTSGGSLTSSVLGSQTDSTSLVSLLQDAAQLDSATGTTTSSDQLFGKIDTNGDGSVSKSELETFESNLEGQSAAGTSGSDTSAVDQLFSAIDTNGDGSISKDEMKTFESKMESAMSAPPPPPPPPSNSTSSLDSLLESLGVNSTTDSTAGSTTTGASASGSSTTDQTNSASAFMALFMEAIGKYMQFGQTASGTANAVSVTG